MNDADFLKLCACGKAAAIARALADGANPKAMDEYGETALIKAAEGGATESVRLLLAAGAEINAAAENGRTALAAASRTPSSWAFSATGWSALRSG